MLKKSGSTSSRAPVGSMSITVNGAPLALGDSVLRSDLHDSLGGQTQSRISPSSVAPLVMVFIQPVDQYGGVDGWCEDGTFHCSGEGASGDQVMRRGNKAIRESAEDGREIHVFLEAGKGKPVTYIGRFSYLDHHEVDAPERGDGQLRSIIVFRLSPVEALPARMISATATPAAKTCIETAGIYAAYSEKATFEPDRELSTIEQQRALVAQKYQRHAAQQGRALERKKIHPKGEARPLFTDLFDAEANLLIESVGSTSRSAVRMAMAQLLDYARFFTPRPSLAVLAPAQLREDLREMLAENGVGLIIPVEYGFEQVLAENCQAEHGYSASVEPGSCLF